MRPRAVGGLEPDDVEQRELVELWHISRTALSNRCYTLGTMGYRSARLDWVVDEFLKAHPEVARKWICVWCERYLGVLANPDAVPVPAWMDGPTNSGHASPVPSRKRARSKNRTKK